MRLLWPVERLSADDNSLMDELRTMLDELEEDMVADKPKNAHAEFNGDVVVYQSESTEDEEDSAESMVGSPFEKVARKSEQKEKES